MRLEGSGARERVVNTFETRVENVYRASGPLKYNIKGAAAPLGGQHRPLWGQKLRMSLSHRSWQGSQHKRDRAARRETARIGRNRDLFRDFFPIVAVPRGGLWSTSEEKPTRCGNEAYILRRSLRSGWACRRCPLTRCSAKRAKVMVGDLLRKLLQDQMALLRAEWPFEGLSTRRYLDRRFQHN